MKHITTCILTVTKLNGIFKRFTLNRKIRLTTESDLKMNYTIFAIASPKPLALSNYNISQKAISMNRSFSLCLMLTLRAHCEHLNSG